MKQAFIPPFKNVDLKVLECGYKTIIPSSIYKVFLNELKFFEIFIMHILL